MAGLGRNAEALEHFREDEKLAGTLLPEADHDIVRSEIARLEALPDGEDAADDGSESGANSQ